MLRRRNENEIYHSLKYALLSFCKTNVFFFFILLVKARNAGSKIRMLRAVT